MFGRGTPSPAPVQLSVDSPSVRILVLGDAGVGKTSLIKLLCGEDGSQSSPRTVGCYLDVKVSENSWGANMGRFTNIHGLGEVTLLSLLKFHVCILHMLLMFVRVKKQDEQGRVVQWHSRDFARTRLLQQKITTKSI
jgi:GTPase SAR1 family protein